MTANCENWRFYSHNRTQKTVLIISKYVPVPDRGESACVCVSVDVLVFKVDHTLVKNQQLEKVTPISWLLSLVIFDDECVRMTMHKETQQWV